uniref:Uncharacterized protein n=1 Tax=Oryza rufipogon TaxID=4529 RepID=A0A0E0QXH2_ORYRU
MVANYCLGDHAAGMVEPPFLASSAPTSTFPARIGAQVSLLDLGFLRRTRLSFRCPHLSVHSYLADRRSKSRLRRHELTAEGTKREAVLRSIACIATSAQLTGSERTLQAGKQPPHASPHGRLDARPRCQQPPHCVLCQHYVAKTPPAPPSWLLTPMFMRPLQSYSSSL